MVDNIPLVETARTMPPDSFLLAGDIAVIDDIAESISKTIFQGTWRFIFKILIEVVLFYTGEIVLFIVTFGNRKPRWDYYVDESASKWVIITEISTWIGFALWLFVAWFINSVLLA